MAREQPLYKRGSHTVDLSTGKPGRKKKSLKGVAPVVQQTINLSTPKPEPAEETSTQPLPETRRKSVKPERKVRSTGNSLADLLDPETLARLRGNT